jgi:hypothetical protein
MFQGKKNKVNYFQKNLHLSNSNVFKLLECLLNFLKVDGIFILQSFQLIKEAAGQLGPQERVIRCSLIEREEAKLSLVHLPTVLRDIYFTDLPVRRRLRRDHQRCQTASRPRSSE